MERVKSYRKAVGQFFFPFMDWVPRVARNGKIVEDMLQTQHIALAKNAA